LGCCAFLLDDPGVVFTVDMQACRAAQRVCVCVCVCASAQPLRACECARVGCAIRLRRCSRRPPPRRLSKRSSTAMAPRSCAG
jgi:hypothetical protein